MRSSSSCNFSLNGAARLALFLHCCSCFLCLCFAAPTQQQDPIVNLGYARYKGKSDPATGYDTFFGMRYAAPPVGDLRFSAPQPPPPLLSGPGGPTTLIDASNNSYPGTVCPQGLTPGLLFSNITAQAAIPISEDCLTLTVYTPSPRSRPTQDYGGDSDQGLPVVVYFHSGAYVIGDHSTSHPQRWLDLADHNVVAVVPNYRLGLFGFLGGEEVYKHGSLNAGLLDQQFALQWVQTHIAKFGGDRSRVTIWGHSAGGGSVIQHLVSNPAYPGNSDNKDLFIRAVVSSPFVPSQYPYNHEVPTGYYETLLNATGCDGQGLACLRKVPTEILARVNMEICATGFIGTTTWAPVIEPIGGYIETRPSVGLLGSTRKLNANRVLTTHVSRDGYNLVDPSVTGGNVTEYVHQLLPSLSQTQVADLISRYPLSEYSNEHERTASIYQDTIFVCPSYWVATAFSGAAYKGIWTVPPATHGQDAGYWLYSGSDYHTLPSPETFENYIGDIVSFIRSGDANLFRLNKKPGQSNRLEWPLFEQRRAMGLVFGLAGDGVGSMVEARSMDRALKARCDWWLTVADVVSQ